MLIPSDAEKIRQLNLNVNEKSFFVIKRQKVRRLRVARQGMEQGKRLSFLFFFSLFFPSSLLVFVNDFFRVFNFM